MRKFLVVTSIYWYAPFDNASEMSLAVAMGALPQYELTVESCRERFGRPLDTTPPGHFNLIRDLPAPAGEGGGARSAWSRARVAFSRASRRQRLVRQESFDLIHLHTYNPFTDWFAIERLRRRVRVVIQSVHNVRPHDSVFPRGVETRLLRRGYQACSGLIVAHELLKQQLEQEFDIPGERISVVPLPVVQAEFPPARARSDDRVEFLFFGTLRRNKGIEVLLDALAALDPSLEVQFVFAGRGDESLEELVRSAAQTDQRITAEIGYVTEERRGELYASADVVVLPYTEFHAQSGVLKDSYGAAKPVIASDIGALGASVRTDRTGWLVQPGDVSGLAARIVFVAQSEEERRTMQRRAAQVGAERGPDQIVRMFAEIYEHLL